MIRSLSVGQFLIDDIASTAGQVDDSFFEDLFKNSTAWGLKVYLQDWLDVETKLLSIFEQDFEIERNWLMKMGHCARRNDINIILIIFYTACSTVVI